MVDPSQFDNMINWAFVSIFFRCLGTIVHDFFQQVVATSIYAIIGYAGYLMFGRNVSDEVSLIVRI
jgi:vesicular inhibitory amino acid transporter